MEGKSLTQSPCHESHNQLGSGFAGLGWTNYSITQYCERQSINIECQRRTQSLRNTARVWNALTRPEGVLILYGIMQVTDMIITTKAKKPCYG